jgi:hypothetical protein
MNEWKKGGKRRLLLVSQKEKYKKYKKYGKLDGRIYPQEKNE